MRMIALLGGVASWGTVQPVLVRKHGREEAMTSSRLLYKLMMMMMNPVLKSLHWLKIKQRSAYKIISLTYTALQHNSPSYLNQELKIQSSRSTCSSSAVTIHRPSVKLETGKRSFTLAAPQLWNSLSTTIRQPATDPLTCRLALTRDTFHKPNTLNTSLC